jgi:hypothetical protein
MKEMDINPLIADLNRHKEELIESVVIAMGFNELKISDEYVARDIAEILGEKSSSHPFQQVACMYRLPLEEVVRNIREFTNKEYKSLMIGDPKYVNDIEFSSEITIQADKRAGS